MKHDKCATCGHERREHFDNVGNDTRCIHHNDEKPVLFCPCEAFVPVILTQLSNQCCERDFNHDGNCDRHPAR